MSDELFPKLESNAAFAATRNAMHARTSNDISLDAGACLQDFWTRLLAAGGQHMLRDND